MKLQYFEFNTATDNKRKLMTSNWSRLDRLVLKVLYRIIYDKCIRIQKQVLQSNTRTYETKCGSLA